MKRVFSCKCNTLFYETDIKNNKCPNCKSEDIFETTYDDIPLAYKYSKEEIERTILSNITITRR